MICTHSIIKKKKIVFRFEIHIPAAIIHLLTLQYNIVRSIILHATIYNNNNNNIQSLDFHAFPYIYSFLSNVVLIVIGK